MSVLRWTGYAAFAALLLGVIGLGSAGAQNVPPAAAQTVPDLLRETFDSPTRAIRRDVPLTNPIRRAFEAGTRDFSGRPGPNYWQLQTDFTIEASLDPSTHTITGQETIVVHNNGPNEMTEIVLRLDHNIFRGTVPRGFSVPAENTEGMVVTRIAVNGELVDLNPAPLRRGQQEPRRLVARGLDQTVAVISLVEPIAGHSTAEVEIAWRTKLPGGDTGRGHRMTQRWGDTLYQPTQWFPRLAKYDDLRGWETQVYLGPAEFFNNFGKFDVRIDVPEGWLVTGTGVLQNPEEVYTEETRGGLAGVLQTDEVVTLVAADQRGPGASTASGADGRLTWHFVAENVNDFAWATAENFVFKATRANIPTRGYIPIYMVHLPDRAHLFENAAPLSRHALEFYSDLWAPYPFPQLTLQDGPSAGMEYPMVINSNQGAADHEVAHQWWPMMVGNNETRYGWMDEGFNSYMNILSRAHRNGEEANLDGLGQSYGPRSGDDDEATLMWAANYAGTSYGFQTYRKTPLMLSMLGGIVGDDAVQAAHAKYTEVWSFKHPSPWDYVFFMSNELDVDLGWFWYYWLWTTDSVDGSIEEVERSGEVTAVTVRQDGQMPSPVVLKVTFADGAEPRLPENAVQMSDGSVEVTWPVDVWFSGSRTFEAVMDFGEAQVTSVHFDPHCRFPDADPSDNVWPANSGSGTCR